MRVEQISVMAGVAVYIFRPSLPLADQEIAAIRLVLSGESQVIEAHLPDAFIPGWMGMPGPLLALRVEGGEEGIDTVLKRLDTTLGPLGNVLIHAIVLSPGHPFWKRVREQDLQLK